MLTMTSLEAQNQFGVLIDTSQRQPVAVTRRGRPVSVVVSYEEYQATTKGVPFHVAKIISEQYPLYGENAASMLRGQLAKMGKQARQEGLTEADVATLVHDVSDE